MTTMTQQKIVQEIFLPSIHDGIRLEARLSYWKVKEHVQEQQVKAVIISHPYGPLGWFSFCLFISFSGIQLLILFTE